MNCVEMIYLMWTEICFTHQMMFRRLVLLPLLLWTHTDSSFLHMKSYLRCYFDRGRLVSVKLECLASVDP